VKAITKVTEQANLTVSPCTLVTWKGAKAHIKAYRAVQTEAMRLAEGTREADPAGTQATRSCV